MARDDEDAPWTRQLLVSVVVLVVVAVVVGGVAGLVALGAARVTGIGQSGSTSSARPSLYLPVHKPTTKPLRSSGPGGSAAGRGDGPQHEKAKGPKGSEKPGHKKGAHKKRAGAISLHASPRKVAAGQRINLTGSYRGGKGARLQVQRFEAGGWSDFPVDVAVHGHRFATYVLTSRTGVNRFRVLDRPTGRHSDPVRVTVG
jgi:hypothetical protein